MVYICDGSIHSPHLRAGQIRFFVIYTPVPGSYFGIEELINILAEWHLLCSIGGMLWIGDGEIEDADEDKRAAHTVYFTFEL